MYDLVESILTMFMDVYKPVDSQDPDTGSIKKEWQFDRTVSCSAKGNISNSASSMTKDGQKFSNKYNNEEMLQIRTSEQVTLREKITNIRDYEGNIIWEELNFPTNTPTVFEVVGTTPMTDPFGGIVGYNSTVKRSENQTIGQ
jgi:hypothetical protein